MGPLEHIRVAAVEYPVEFLSSWDDYVQKISGFFHRAKAEGVNLLVFPEYAAMELASLLNEWLYSQLDGQILALQEYRDAFINLHQSLSDKTGIFALAASFPWRVGYSFDFRNRAWFISPGDKPQWQEKMVMTRFEREKWHISPGYGLNVFETPWGKTGALLCYDSEFPFLGRCLAEQGAEVLLVPSCTDTPSGYHRVRISASARALENQCYAIQSPTIGNAPWSPALDVNYGHAGIFTPMDDGFPEDGVLAVKADKNTGLLVSDLDLHHLHHIREHGQTLNFRDWNEQFR